MALVTVVLRNSLKHNQITFISGSQRLRFGEPVTDTALLLTCLLY